MEASTGSGQPLRFGAFELDVRSRELRKGSKAVRLQEQPFAILRMMLERPGHVVTREELRRRLWPEGTFVDFEHSLNAAVKRLRAALGDDADNPRFVETLPRRGYRFIGSLDLDASGAAEAAAAGAPRRRLAVLPFASLSDEFGQEYFADGLTEEMIAQLGQLCRGRVGVLARWSSMVFKGTTQRASEIGQALKADYLLEGSVRREADRVRITARLVQTKDETVLWVQTYERALTDCLSVQADVASRIAQSLAMELAPDAASSAHAETSSPWAYQEYLKGRYHWNKLDDERETGAASNLEQALACFTRALQVDADFAAAHGIAARVHIARAQQYVDVPRRALELARGFATRAVALDPGLAEGHLALGDVRRMLAWDWRGAEDAYTRAIALNPSAENARRRYSLMLAVQSRREESIRDAERACELDPLCLVVRVSAALVHYFAGDYDAAIERCRHIIELGPQYLPARRLIGAAYLQAGRAADALQALESALTEVPDAPIALSWLAHAKAVTGDRAGAALLLERWRGLERAPYLPPFHLALALVGLEAFDEAFAALERARVENDPALAYLAVDPRFAPLRGDGRFVRITTAIGL